MEGPHISCGIVWSDPDLLELEAAIAFGEWTGRERAYVGVEELLEFAAALDEVARDGREASLSCGQEDLSVVALHIREYDRARHLMLSVHLARAAGTIMHHPDYPTELRLTVPVERGRLGAFANGLREIARAERGTVFLPLPPQWP